MRPLLLLLATLLATLTASAQLPSYVPTDGLVAWYPLDGNATDLGGNAFNGTESGTTGAVSRDGTTNGALEFNGSSHVNLGDSNVLNPAELSISCWFQIQNWNTQNGLSTILGRNLNNGSHRYGFNMGIIGPNNTAIGQTGLRFGFDDDSNSGNLIHDYNIPEPLNLNEWYHFGITMNLQEEELIFYLNGTVIAAENIPSAGVNPIDTDVLMGFYRPNGDHSLNGLLDDVGIWNRTLSDVEMTGIYSETPPLLGCIDANACNYDAEANADDGSCIPSGCMEEGACNYNADAECEGEACDYSCCPGPGCCGDGMHWDADAQTCVITPPSVAPDTECTLFNLQELAEGYQILEEAVAELQLQLDSCSQQPNQNENPDSENSCLAGTSEYESITPIFLGQLLDVNYYSIGPNLTWNEAQTIAQCISPNCHLATVHSSSENSIFTSWTQELETQEHWIGLYQNFNSSSFNEPSGGWGWVDGSPETYRNWAGPEPNNGSQFEHHAHMNHVNWGLGVWNDGHGDLYRFRALIQLPTAESALLD